MNDIQKEAGLWTQIRKLKKRIDSLDMDKVDPVELKSAIDSLKDMESRYSEMQEKKKQRRLDKETKEKSTPMPVESAPVEPTPAPAVENRELAPPPPVEAPVEKSADVDVEAAANQDVIDAFVGMTNHKVRSQHLFMEVVSDDTWNLVNYNTVIAINEGSQIKLNYRYYSQTTRKIQNKIWWTAQQMGLTVLDAATGEPIELGNKPKKQMEAPVEEVPEEVPMAAEKKEATTSKYALDDVVEPVYGSAGSYGRIMRYDADKDMAYVHWDSGKLQADHGFGAYKGSDLRKRASLKKADHDEPMGDVWTLESKDEEFAANILSGIAQKAIEGDIGEQQYLSSLWGEKWPQVKKKLEAEGSTWYVWWMDGVREFLQGMQENDGPQEAPKKEAAANPGECPVCRRSSDMKDQGDGKSKCSWCGTVTPNEHLDGRSNPTYETSGKEAATPEGLNGYIGYYKGKQFETYAKTSYEAQQKIAREHGIKKSYEITVVLAEKGGEPVVHKPQDVVGSDAIPQMDTKCESCGKELGPEAFLSKWPVCGDCTKKRHKKVTQSEQDGIGYGGDRPGMAVAPKRDEDVSLTSGKYTGDMDKDLTVLLPHIVADGVSQNDRELSDWLVERARQIYKHNPEWGKKVARENDAARDFLWQFMEHWAKAKQSGVPMESSLTASAEPSALGWWMKEQGYRPKKSALDTDGNPDAQDVVDTYINGNISDARAWLAKNPDLFPEAMRLMRQHDPKGAQRFVDLVYPYRKSASLNKNARGPFFQDFPPEVQQRVADAVASHLNTSDFEAIDDFINRNNDWDSLQEFMQGMDIEQVEQHVNMSAKTADHMSLDPMYLELAQDEIESGSDVAHDVAAEHGQMFENVRQMKWFVEAVAKELSEQHPIEAPVETQAAGQPGEGQVMELNIANRKWTAKRTSGAGSPDAWVIFDDQGKQIMAITMSERELSQPELEQIVFNELGKKDLVRATLNVDLSIMKKGHKVRLVSVDLVRKEAKFASLESSSLAGWTKLERFDITIDAAEREPKLDRHCKECGSKIPLSFEEGAICRDCERKKEHPHKEAILMPLSKNETTVRIKSTKTLVDLAKNCPDCYKKFLKFAKEKGLRINADDLTDHVDQMRTKMTQTKEVLQTQTQAAEVTPEVVETEAALPPKPNVNLPDGMKLFFNRQTNTWEVIADETLRY